MKQSFDVIQLGARMHYAIPEILHQNQLLGSLFTDIWIHSFASKLLSRIPLSPLQKLAGRSNQLIPDSKVISNFRFGYRYAKALQLSRTNREFETKLFLQFSKEFQDWILNKYSLTASGIYAYNTVAFELFSDERNKQKLKILEQTLVPRTIENKWLKPEYERFQLSYSSGEYATQYGNLELKEAQLADKIVTGSQFVKNSLIDLGIDSEKITVVPYGYTSTQKKLEKTSSLPKRFLFAGNGGIRKGISYLLEAASAFPQCTFTIAGVMESVIHSLPKPSNVTFLGVVDRNQMPKIYSEHDVFILPSLCEGSATVTYEALSYGLPVLCTPNSGSIITHKKDGILFDVKSSESIKEAIEFILTEQGLFEYIRNQAIQTAKNYTVEAYGKRIINTIIESI